VNRAFGSWGIGYPVFGNHVRRRLIEWNGHSQFVWQSEPGRMYLDLHRMIYA
jgi:hypothetical protein